MKPIGIMQGRLSPPLADNPQYFPEDHWQREFSLAREVGFDAIEWLFDAGSGEDNPVMSPAGRPMIRDVAQAHGVSLSSICGDYFKLEEHSLASGDTDLRSRNAAVLSRLLEAASDLGIECILVTFLEGSTLPTNEARVLAEAGLEGPLERASGLGVTIAMETDLPAAVLAPWLRGIGHRSLGVYYDLGNAVAAGYDPSQEIPLLAPWIRGVHVKDRTFDGPNVPLGTGSVDFAACFGRMREADYKGALVLETVRGARYLEDARRNLAFVRERLASPEAQPPAEQ